MSRGYGYDRDDVPPFKTIETISSVEAGCPSVEVVNMRSGQALLIPMVIWQEMVLDWAEHFQSLEGSHHG